MTELQVLKDNIRVLLKLEYGTDINIKDDWNLLWYLCKKNRVELLKDLIKEGFDINIKNNYNTTALMIVSFYDNLKIVRLLLENNADLNIKDSLGNTALIYASEYNHLEIIDILKKYGAKE